METPLASWFRLFSLSEENEFEAIVERNESPIDDNTQVERWEWYLFIKKRELKIFLIIPLVAKVSKQAI